MTRTSAHAAVWFPALAALLVAAVLGVQVANGGGDFVPARPADPCTRAQPKAPAELEPLAERLVLAGLDATACAKGVSRERLLLSLDAGDAEALRSGLLEAVDRLDLPRVSTLLPEVLDLADLPGLAKTALEAIPDGVVDDLLPTRPLLRRVIAGLDVRDVLRDPAGAEPALRDAILDAARDQVLAKLPG